MPCLSAYLLMLSSWESSCLRLSQRLRASERYGAAFAPASEDPITLRAPVKGGARNVVGASWCIVCTFKPGVPREDWQLERVTKGILLAKVAPLSTTLEKREDCTGADEISGYSCKERSISSRFKTRQFRRYLPSLKPMRKYCTRSQSSRVNVRFVLSKRPGQRHIASTLSRHSHSPILPSRQVQSICPSNFLGR
ncbi:ORF [Tomato ringspot virus]|uniref:Uncharacterized protein in RNA2 n=1 Tax=Tomato ringspot virus (isolate raspberry) TaxID=12281 RepID=YR22_TORVR|nr:RecName: Full=Uncharacterized protein in RNA2 [Tomato ringspot virus (isolate raspberry)]BAA02045.1 ORF [Tomato ringspot virus]